MSLKTPDERCTYNVYYPVTPGLMLIFYKAGQESAVNLQNKITGIWFLFFTAGSRSGPSRPEIQGKG